MKSLHNIFLVLPFTALASTLPAVEARAESWQGTFANECVSTGDRGLENSCSFWVSVTWCVEGIDCNGGRYTNLANIAPGGAYPYNGYRTSKRVNFGVCRGRDTASSYGTQPYSWTYKCRTE